MLVQRNGNMTCDITSLVHRTWPPPPCWQRVVGLDIAGVDVVTKTSPARWQNSAGRLWKSTPALAC